MNIMVIKFKGEFIMKKPDKKKIIYVIKCVIGLSIFAWGFNAMLVTLNKPRNIPVATTINAVHPIKDVKR